MIDLKQNLSKWTMLPLLTLIYGVGELGHFLIGVVIRSVSQDIGFGDKSCLAVSHNNFGNSSSKVSDTFCSKYETPEGCLAAHVDNHTNVASCEWNYNGLGIEYQVLAGPVFMCCFTLFGLMWGFIGDRLNRVHLLSIAIVIYSFGISGTAFSHEYWHIVLFRMVLAAGASASSPLAAGMIGDVYPPHQRALAMAVFNWGIYFGFGGSFAVGNYINDKSIFDQPWRTSFLFSGLPGIVIVILFFLTVNEPRNSKREKEENLSPSAPKYELKEKIEVESNILNEQENPEDDGNNRESVGHTLLVLAKRPEIIILAFASCIRHSAGYCWGYNSALYFQTYYPDFDATMWLTGISIGGGVVGCLIGGFVSDRLVNRMGMSSRALVLAGSQLLSTPFTFGLLYMEPPYCFICLFMAIITSEMWFAVVYAMLIELVPVHVRSTFMGIALLIINNAGGNLPILVKPWRSVTDYRTAIAIHYPGALLTSSVLFFICWIFLRRK